MGNKRGNIVVPAVVWVEGSLNRGKKSGKKRKKKIYMERGTLKS